MPSMESSFFEQLLIDRPRFMTISASREAYSILRSIGGSMMSRANFFERVIIFPYKDKCQYKKYC